MRLTSGNIDMYAPDLLDLIPPGLESDAPPRSPESRCGGRPRKVYRVLLPGRAVQSSPTAQVMAFGPRRCWTAQQSDGRPDLPGCSRRIASGEELWRCPTDARRYALLAWIPNLRDSLILVIIPEQLPI